MKTEESIVSQKVGSRDFWHIANSVLNRGKSDIPPLFNGPEVLTSASEKAKLYAELFSKTLILMILAMNFQVSIIELTLPPEEHNYYSIDGKEGYT